MIDIDEKTLGEIKFVLKKNLKDIPAKTYFFGSRVNGKARKYSDVDIAISAKKQIPFDVMARIDFEFEMSLISYIVDVIDLNATSENFIKHIEKDLVEFSY
jgi:predicted nucleotidyltransferase